jgi:hypothetical protein
MTPLPENDSGPKPKSRALRWLGLFLLAFGATLVGAFIVRQLKESDTGHTYYEFIGGGALLAVVGMGVVGVARRK